jgi:DNA-directed DNA polymerase III alpha subunit
VYERFITELIEKKTVYIEGKIQIDNYKGESTSKLLVDKLVELDKIYEYPAKKLFILIEPEDSYRYSRLKDLINFNKGKTQIVLAIKNKDEKKLQTMNKGIKLSKEFFENLVELMGIDKIKIVM